MNNIIEHVQNTVSFLQKANIILKTGGRVLCSTPNGVQDGAMLKAANSKGTVLNMLENHFFYYKPKTLRKIFEYCGFRILKSYCDGLKHSLKDFGLLPGAGITDSYVNYKLSDYEFLSNKEFETMADDLESMKSDPSLKTSRIKFNLFINRISKLRIPSAIPIGHQQTVLAEKI